MKFLVTALPRVAQGITSSMVESSREIINTNTKSGVNDCVYSFSSGGGFGIVNAESGERLAELLMELPTFPFFEWETHPLADFNKTQDKVIEMLKKQGL